MKGYKTSFVGMFLNPPDGMEPVRLIEIPLIQRDYAQGRDNPDVALIRNEFLDILMDAITGEKRVDLDFVYGEIEDGTFEPLDGQQRLTTLFLIHWYVAARLGRLTEAQPWLQLRYATRPTAELFSRELINPQHGPSGDFDEKPPQVWIKDQPWYLHSWRHDPTVASMLTMLDAIHGRFCCFTHTQLDSAWSALTKTDGEPAIGFDYLPIDDMPSGEDLYIKMNSRGKPLTRWESLKARLEKVMAKALNEETFNQFVQRLDGPWTDVLWRLEADSEGLRVDDSFERYLEFIVEVCEWRDGATIDGTLLERAERTFTDASPHAAHNVEFLFHAFDTWTIEVEDGRREPIDVSAVFTRHFASAAELGTDIGDRVLLFEEATDVNLFGQCCKRYGLRNGKARLFTLAQSLALLAVLIHRQYPTDSVQHRLRVLRNLSDTADEVNGSRMVELVEGVQRLMQNESIDDALDWLAGPRGTFNPDRLADEREKLRLLEADAAREATVYGLEDHYLLRGRIFPFGLDPESLDLLAVRAEAFAAVSRIEFWPLLTGALLAKGDYGFTNGNSCQMGTGRPEHGQRWREVLTRYGRKNNADLRRTLALLLDDVAARGADTRASLVGVMEDFVAECQSGHAFPWHYYLVAYPIMRSGDKGVYYGEYLASTGHWAYSMCMLNTASLRGGAIYLDPYLSAMRQVSGVSNDVIPPSFNLGDEAAPRWMRLAKSETGIRCVTGGLELEPPQDETLLRAFDEVCAANGVVNGVLPVAQNERAGELVDTEDRVTKAAALLNALVEAGL